MDNGYVGSRMNDNVIVLKIVDGIRTGLKHHVYHSPTGFNWGYGGSGPAELARCILADAIGEHILKEPSIYQSFKDSFVSSWEDVWEISLDDVKRWYALASSSE